MDFFERHVIFLDSSQALVKILDQFLRTNYPDDLSRTRRVGSKLAAGIRGDHHLSVFSHSMDAAGSIIGRGSQLADLATLCCAVHRKNLWTQRIIFSRF